MQQPPQARDDLLERRRCVHAQSLDPPRARTAEPGAHGRLRTQAAERRPPRWTHGSLSGREGRIPSPPPDGALHATAPTVERDARPRSASAPAVPSSSSVPAAALLCTIGGEEVVLDKPGLGREGGRAWPPACPARGGARPRARTAQFPNPEPAPGGVRREYWIQARTVGWNIVPTGRDDWHGRKIGGKTGLPRLRLPGDDRRVRGAQGRHRHARADAVRGGRRPARRALPQRRHEAAPGGDHAPPRRPLQPGVRRRLHGQVHARRRVRGARRGVHVPVGVRARRRRRLAVPRPRPQPHAQHLPRAVRLDRDHRARGQACPTSTTR